MAVRIISPSDLPCECAFPAAVCEITDIDNLPSCDVDGMVYRVCDPNCGRPFLVFCKDGQFWPVAADGDAYLSRVSFSTDGTPSDPDFLVFPSGVATEQPIIFNNITFDDCNMAALPNGFTIVESGRYMGSWQAQVFPGSDNDVVKDLRVEFAVELSTAPPNVSLARGWLTVNRNWTFAGPNLVVGGPIGPRDYVAGDTIIMNVLNDVYNGLDCGAVNAYMAIWRIDQCQINCDTI